MKRLFKALFRAIKNETRALRIFILKYSSTAVDVVDHIRKAVNDPKVHLIVSLTPSKVDDRILNVLRVVFTAILPNIELKDLVIPPILLRDVDENNAKEVKERDKALKDLFNSDFSKGLNEIVENIRNLSPELQKAAFLKIASLITKELAKEDNHELSSSESDTLAQLAFKAKREVIAI